MPAATACASRPHLAVTLLHAGGRGQAPHEPDHPSVQHRGKHGSHRSRPPSAGAVTLLASFETRRDKALVRIAHYRGELGAVLRKASNQLIESKVVELPRAASKKRTRRRERTDGKVVELDGPRQHKERHSGLNVARSHSPHHRETCVHDRRQKL